MNRQSIRGPAVGLLLVIVTFAAFWQALSCGFVNYDDARYIGNPHVRTGLTGDNIIWALTTIHASNWHPLTSISHMLDCHLYGLKPWGHHLTNLLLHALNTLLLFLVLTRMTKSLWRSGFAAALFAIHPLHVESVAWVAERKDVLSGFFWMLTMAAYVSYVEQPSLKRHLLVVLLFALGLTAKPMLVTLPFVLLLLDYWPLRRFEQGTARKKRRSWAGWKSCDSYELILEKLPLFALAAASSAITCFVQHKGGAMVSLSQVPFGIRIANALMAYISYIWKTVWPSGLAVFYPYPADAPAAWKVLAAVLFLVCVSALAIRMARRHPYLAAGWLWYLGTLVPVIGLVQVGEQAMADRYTYIPLIGLFVMVTWGVSDVATHLIPMPWRRFLISIPAGAIIGALAITTWFQVSHWRNDVALFGHAVNVTKGNYLAHNLLGAALGKQGMLEKAIEHYREALRIKPGYALAHNGLASALARQGKFEEAILEYRESLRINPNCPLAHYNLGLILAGTGELDEAITHLSRVIEINRGPGGQPEMFMQEPEENARRDIARLSEKLRAEPNDLRTRYELGILLAQEGMLEEAVAHLTRVVRLSKVAQSKSVRQGALRQESPAAKRESPSDVIAYYRKVLQTDPDNAEAHFHLANALSSLGNREAAIREYREAIRIKPDFAIARNNLAVALYLTGKYAEAWAEVRLCEKYGGKAHPDFLKALSQKMPDPGQ